MVELKKIVGRYQILDVAGQWGEGDTVYRAQDELLNRLVAIKIVPHSMESLAHSQLMNEARIMARLQHPNILPIHDYIRDDNAAYTIMPLMDRNAISWFQGSEAKPLAETFRFLDRVADALDFLHKHRIVYRDLKPANILVSEDNQPYLIDFAFAQLHDPDHNISNDEIAGTLSYMDPALFGGIPASSASDIFSFGIMTYELITGQNPILNLLTNSSFSYGQLMLYEGVSSILEYRPELSLVAIRDIDAVLRKMTAKNPDERYQTAREAVSELNRIINSGQPIVEGKLFISYARKDEKFVHDLVQELKNYNVELWLDKNMEAGSAWDESIDNQLASCDAILVIVTPASMASPYVTYEWSYFIGANKPVLPFVPDFALNGLEMHPRLSRVQYIKGSAKITQNVQQIIQVMS